MSQQQAYAQLLKLQALVLRKQLSLVQAMCLQQAYVQLLKLQALLLLKQLSLVQAMCLQQAFVLPALLLKLLNSL